MSALTDPVIFDSGVKTVRLTSVLELKTKRMHESLIINGVGHMIHFLTIFLFELNVTVGDEGFELRPQLRRHSPKYYASWKYGTKIQKYFTEIISDNIICCPILVVYFSWTRCSEVDVLDSVEASSRKTDLR